MRAPRASIAGIMGAVLVAAIGLAALRSGSVMWAGITFLLACSLLTLAVVGAVCRGRSERAWHLGFALFGWGYLTLAFWPPEGIPTLPTAYLLDALRSSFAPPGSPGALPGGMGGSTRAPISGGGFGGMAPALNVTRDSIGHSLFSLLVAALGGLAARSLFAARDVGAEAPAALATRGGGSSRMGRLAAWVAGIAAIVLVASLARAGMRSGPWFWAGALYLLTWGLLGLAALGAASGRGRRRMAWLGAALFGIGYMLLVYDPRQPSWSHMAANQLLPSLRPRSLWFVRVSPASSRVAASANARLLEALERPVPMRFPVETPLEDVLKWVRAATRDADGRDLPIFVDPVGLAEAEKTMTSPVVIDVEGVPLRRTLREILRELGLVYSIRDGLLVITADIGDEPFVYEDPFLLAGHCLLAWVAAGVGGLAARIVFEPRHGGAGGPSESGPARGGNTS